LGSVPEQATKKKYVLPANVVSLTEVFLFERLPDWELEPGKPGKAWKKQFYNLLRALYGTQSDERRYSVFWQVLDQLEFAGDKFTFGNLCRDFEAWELVCDVYEQFAPGESFLDFFWTGRFLHLPLWSVLRAVSKIPPARLYHSVSTGYAGALGAIAARKANAPLLLTEHGIYTKERIAEISQAAWIYETSSPYLELSEGLGTFKKMWINLFAFLGTLTYQSASRIIALYQGITALQVEFGADEEQIRVIPNGIDPTKLNQAFAARQERLKQGSSNSGVTIGFIGRVVPIKDVKTLIRAAQMVIEKRPDTVFQIIGPTDEDPEYYKECFAMVELFGLKESIRFLGSQKIAGVMADLDIVLLTSISEGLPLIILEAFSAGIPVVATDVGACRELIFGRTAEDKALGRAGMLTPISSPEETADALLAIINSPESFIDMGLAGRRRVEKYYRQQDIMNQYRCLYRDLSTPTSTDASPHQKTMACN
jgi:glycosyltransferase involved in cell wall biosynthesis